MNIEQRDKLIELINADCTLRCNYLNAQGDTCVIGKMAQAAGIDNSVLSDAGSKGIGHMILASFCLTICNFWGLTTEQLQQMQIINDDYIPAPYAETDHVAWQLAERRRRLVAYVMKQSLTTV